MATPLDLVRLLTEYRRQQEVILRVLLAYIRRVWLGLGRWHTGDVERFAAVVVPVVIAAEQRVAALTSAYLSAHAQASGVAAGVSGQLRLREVSGQALRGVDPQEVYQRPGGEVWRALAEDVPLGQAVQRGLTRAESLAATDVQLAKTHTARQALADDTRVVGFRRVLKGEESCGLCVVASTQRYHAGDLLPIHPACDCDVEPLYGTEEPEQVIDADLLQAAHDAIEKRFGRSAADAREIDYRKILLVREHGELGPVLTVKSHRFTGPDELAAS